MLENPSILVPCEACHTQGTDRLHVGNASLASSKTRSCFQSVPEWREHLAQWFTRSTTPSEKDSQWESLDSMTIRKLGDNRFQAQIQYLDKEGRSLKARVTRFTRRSWLRKTFRTTNANSYFAVSICRLVNLRFLACT